MAEIEPVFTINNLGTQEDAPKDKRQVVRSLVPPDLQLRFPQLRPDRQKWWLDGELNHRRGSEKIFDQLFYQSLRSYQKMDPNLLIKTDRDVRAQQERLADILDLQIVLQQTARQFLTQDSLSHAGAFALLSEDTETANKTLALMLERKKEYYTEAAELAIALGRTGLAKILQTTAYKNFDPKSAGIIAAQLNDFQFIDKVMLELSAQERAEVAAYLTDSYPDRCAEIFLEVADKPLAQGTIRLALALASHQPGLMRKITASHPEILQPNGLPLRYRALVAYLIDEEPQQKAILEHAKSQIKGRELGYAAALLGDTPTASKVSIREESDAVAEIAFLLEDYTTARDALTDYLEHPSRVHRHEFPFDLNLLTPVLQQRLALATEHRQLLETLSNYPYPIYAKTMASWLLKHRQDLGWLSLSYMPSLQSSEKLAEKVNSGLEGSKRWSNPKKILEDHQPEIAALHRVNLRLANQMLSSFIRRGLSYTEANLKLFSPLLENEELLSSLRLFTFSLTKFEGKDLAGLLEIASAYQRMGQTKLFIAQLNTIEKDWTVAKKRLNRALLALAANNLRIEAKVTNQEINKWKLEYIANLLSNREMLQNKMENEGGDPADIQLFEGILRACFENRFPQFITSLTQPDQLGRQIARHNQQVKSAYETAGIDWDQWVNFDGIGRMTVGTKSKADPEALPSQLHARFTALADQLTQLHPSLGRSFNKDIRSLTSKKNFKPDKINLSDPNWLFNLSPTLGKSISHLIATGQGYSFTRPIQEAIAHLQESLRQFNPDDQEQTEQKSFMVRKWLRDPRRDLFQGNATHNCIAVGVKATAGGGLETLHPDTILHYLIDQGIQVIEVVDPDSDEPVAQAWLFVSLDQKGRPVMVADNIEAHSRYPAGSSINLGIRESVFQYMEKYAKACHIPQAVLTEIQTNDVVYTDLPMVELPPARKLGDYLNNREYFLEAIGRTQFREVYSKE